MELYVNMVPVYQHDPTVDQNQYHSIIIDGKRVQTGLKWQCVELARRYFLVTKGITFPSIPNAYDIFDLAHMIHFSSGKKVAIHKHHNGSIVKPTVGSLLLWGKEYDQNETGHVAVIIGIYPHSIQIMEQNNSTSHRTIPTYYNDKTNQFYIVEKHILGWISI